MSVQLISVSHPVYGAFTDPSRGGKISMTPVDMIAYCARVSNRLSPCTFGASSSTLMVI